MIENRIGLFALSAACAVAGCGSDENLPRQEERVGQLEVALTDAPEDAACVRIAVAGSRTDIRTLPLTSGEDAVFQLDGMPVGVASVSADAFDVECSELIPGVNPSWYSEGVAVDIKAGIVTHVALLMIHNGQVSVGVDFGEEHGPTNTGEVGNLTGGSFSSAQPYLVPTAPGVTTTAILTVGDSVDNGYRMVGIPDGMGAFDNGDGTFTLLATHELTSSNGVPRAHGARGAFVSQWIIRKADFAVLSGGDLMVDIVLWNPTTSSYDPPATGVAFSRFCSADLPAPAALFDVASGKGFDGQLFFGGEENGSSGRAVAHGLDGVTYELPRMGKMSFENVVASPMPGETTVVAGMDDSGGGQVYFYFGTKNDAGATPVDRAGLTNGTLYGLRVPGSPSEGNAGIATGPFELHEFGNVENWTGSRLETESSTNGVTAFNRPEDGAWDPNNPKDYYFVTTASFSSNSRLWRARFDDLTDPASGGTFEMLLDGSEGQHMMDNLAIDQHGHVYVQEDVGGNNHIGKVFRYDIASDTLTEVLQHNPVFFDPTAGSPTFITRDEESSGIIDMADILGPGWMLANVQAHTSAGDTELVQPGQFLAIFDPAAAGE
jgi:hypothetical protein